MTDYSTVNANYAKNKIIEKIATQTGELLCDEVHVNWVSLSLMHRVATCSSHSHKSLLVDIMSQELCLKKETENKKIILRGEQQHFVIKTID